MFCICIFSRFKRKFNDLFNLLDIFIFIWIFIFIRMRSNWFFLSLVCLNVHSLEHFFLKLGSLSDKIIFIFEVFEKTLISVGGNAICELCPPLTSTLAFVKPTNNQEFTRLTNKIVKCVTFSSSLEFVGEY